LFKDLSSTPFKPFAILPTGIKLIAASIATSFLVIICSPVAPFNTKVPKGTKAAS